MSPVAALLRLTRFSARYVILCLLFSIFVFVVCPVLLGLATQAFFNALSERHAGSTALLAVVAIVVIQVGSAMASPAFGNPWSPMQQKAHVLLRRNLFAAILRLHGRHETSTSAGDAVSRFRDDPELIADTLDALCDLIGRSLFVVIAGIVMWQIDPTMTLVLALPLAICSAFTRMMSGRIRALRSASRASTGELTSFLGDLMSAQLAVKVAGAGNHVIARLDRLGDERRRMEVRDTVFNTLLEAVNLNVGNIGTGLVLLLGAGAMSRGTFTVGDLALFVVYLDAVGWYPDEISRLIGGLKQAEVSLSRMAGIVPGLPVQELTRPAAVYIKGGGPHIPVPPPVEPLEALEIRGLTYNHSGVECGIADISFTVQPGSMTVVTGMVGAGKSTLLRVLLGHLPADAGEIWWNGRLVEDRASFFVPPRSAYTPQVPRLFSETIRENALLGWRADQAELETAVGAAILGADVTRLEHGIDTLIGPRGVKLSGGQVQRLAAARMFVRHPQLLVIDDLSSSLDAHTEAALWDQLFARLGKEAYLVVSHRPAVLRRADQVLVMAHGRIEEMRGG